MKSQLKAFISELILFAVGLASGITAIIELPYAFGSVREKGLPAAFLGNAVDLVAFAMTLFLLFLCGFILLLFSLYGIKNKQKKAWPNNVSFVASIVFVTASAMIAFCFAIIFLK